MCLTRQHQSKMYLNVSKCIQMYLNVLFHVLSQLDPHLMLLRWTSQLRSPTTRRSSLSKWWGLDPRSRWFTRRKSKDNWTLPNFYLVWWLQTFHRKTINFSSFFFPRKFSSGASAVRTRADTFSFTINGKTLKAKARWWLWTVAGCGCCVYGKTEVLKPTVAW